MKKAKYIKSREEHYKISDFFAEKDKFTKAVFPNLIISVFYSTAMAIRHQFQLMKPENLTGPSSLLSTQRIPDLNREFTHMRSPSFDASFFNMTVLQEDPASVHKRAQSYAMFPKLPSMRDFTKDGV